MFFLEISHSVSRNREYLNFNWFHLFPLEGGPNVPPLGGKEEKQFPSANLLCYIWFWSLSVISLYTGLVDAIREDVSMLTLLAEVLCLLDMMVNSFAHTISSKPVDRYTRPNFTGKPTLSCQILQVCQQQTYDWFSLLQ